MALILGLPAVLIVLTAHRWSYVAWMFIYLLSLPIWNFVLPTYAYWKFDDFSWGDTRKTAGEKTKKAGIEYEGEFDSSKITMRRWHDFEAGKAPPSFCTMVMMHGQLMDATERRLKGHGGGYSQSSNASTAWPPQHQQHGYDSYYDN